MPLCGLQCYSSASSSFWSAQGEQGIPDQSTGYTTGLQTLILVVLMLLAKRTPHFTHRLVCPPSVDGNPTEVP